MKNFRRTPIDSLIDFGIKVIGFATMIAALGFAFMLFLGSIARYFLPLIVVGGIIFWLLTN